MATRAVSYGSLRGFARVGGVLIGRDPEGGSISTESFEWQLDERGFTFSIKAESGTLHHFGPYKPAIVNLALAYAADGRPTTVTMVSAAPLQELKDSDTSRAHRYRPRLQGQAARPVRGRDYRRECRAEGHTRRGAFPRHGRDRPLYPRPIAPDWSLFLERDRDAGPTGQRSGGTYQRRGKRPFGYVARHGERCRARAGGPLEIGKKPEFFDTELVGHVAACRTRRTLRPSRNASSPVSWLQVKRLSTTV